MLSYFGCDQSQVQRYLTAKSVEEGRHSLMMSAFVKIPLQALVLLTGVLVFVFYLFQQPPMLFNPVHAERIAKSERAAEFQPLEGEFDGGLRGTPRGRRDARRGGDGGAAGQARATFAGDRRARSARSAPARRSWCARSPATSATRIGPATRRRRTSTTSFRRSSRRGCRPASSGLIIAAIFAAAMSTIAAELNSLATSSVIDIYRRLLKPTATDAHYLSVSKLLTGFWGLVACVVAIYAAGLGSLIEVVNRFGSFFYGSLLGVFVLALGFKRATGTGAFVGSARRHGGGRGGRVSPRDQPASRSSGTIPIGVIAVVVVGLLVSLMTQPARRDRHEDPVVAAIGVAVLLATAAVAAVATLRPRHRRRQGHRRLRRTAAARRRGHRQGSHRRHRHDRRAGRARGHRRRRA